MITAVRLREVLVYDAETGIFIRKAGARNMALCLIGEIAGTINGQGYVQISVDGRTYLAHRLAWLYVTGEWPRGKLDHKNLVKTQNRISNLRLATNSENLRNRNKPRNNTSGFKGVSWIRKYRLWQATIKFNGRNVNLGRFETKEDAASAYNRAALQHHGKFARLDL